MLKPALVALFVFGLISRGVAFSTEPAQIPFRFADGFIRVEVQLNSSSKPLSMLLDSGASVSVLNLTTARRLHLETGKPRGVRGVTADAQAYGIEPLSAMISGIKCGFIALAADMSRADELCSGPVDGLIGVDFFRNRIVQIDYSKQCIRLLTDSSTPAASQRLPVKVINGLACVGVGVNGSSPRWTRLDTGCNDSLHWVVPKLARSGTQSSASIGFVTDALDLAPSRVALGTLAVDSVPVALHGRPFFDGEAGLLGNGLLSRFTVTLDWNGKSLILKERR
jgi:hypothetical protein